MWAVLGPGEQFSHKIFFLFSEVVAAIHGLTVKLSS